MKLAIAMVLFSAQALAATGSLHYTAGPARGDDVTVNQTYIGYNEICYKGNPAAARTALYEVLKDSYERESMFARYNAATKSITYGYVDTKCTDEMANDPADCRVVMTAQRCR